MLVAAQISSNPFIGLFVAVVLFGLGRMIIQRVAFAEQNPWLVRIMHNLHSSRAGRESRAPRAMDTERLDASSGKSDGTLPPINPASFDAMDEKLVWALESLPSEYQSVLLLWAVEEFSYKEIAEAMDIPIGTVMSRLHRSRQKLSDLLGGAAPDGERT